MDIKEFSEDELKIVREIEAYRRPNWPKIPIYDFPISQREAYTRFMRKEPVWEITGIEMKRFNPAVYIDNIARGYVAEAVPLPKEEWGGRDMFGVEWEYDEENRGSAVVPGVPMFADANDWEEKLVWPDIDSWDWEGSAKQNHAYVSGDNAVIPVIMNGYFERLISFMDFGNAAIALIDDGQQDAVKQLFDKLTDMYIRIVDKFIEHYNADAFLFHDDWGSQNGPLFSMDTAKDVIVPSMKRLTDHIHNRSKIAELHSCGILGPQVQNVVAAGWDTWSPQAVNDTGKIFDEYGDKIIIGVIPEQMPDDAGDEYQRQEAANFVDRYCNPDKLAVVSIYGAEFITPVFREELYRLSRKKFSC